MLQKRKKTTESKSRSKSTSSSGFCGSTVCLLVVAIVIMIGYSWYMLGKSSNLVNFIKAEASVEQKNFQELLDKAHALALRYRNLTGKLPEEHHEVIQSISSSKNLRRPDIAQIKTDGSKINKQVSGAIPTVTTVAGLTAEGKKDIMIGIAQEMDPKNFAVFCISFREVSPKADLVIFVNSPISDKITKIATENDVTLLEYNLRTLDGGMSNFHPSTIRWPLIAKFFESPDVREKYGRVWMADVRDTYFQSDPFEMLPRGEQGFLAFTGVDITIGSCGWNGGWVKDCFGESMLGIVGIQKIICSGVSMGDMDSVYAYLEAFNDIVSNKRMTELGRKSKFPQCERNGVDQVGN